MNAPATPIPANDAPALPTVEQVEMNITVLFSMVVKAFGQMGVDGLTINAVGKILSEIEFGTPLAKADFKKKVHDAATNVVEQAKVLSLRNSILNVA